jgi:hypothetical protein
MPYHLKKIKKGVLGKSSKIMEEVEELQDAEDQGVVIMAQVELSDIYGALEECAKSYGLSMADLQKMSNVTKRAFLSGHRSSGTKDD